MLRISSGVIVTAVDPIGGPDGSSDCGAGNRSTGTAVRCATPARRGRGGSAWTADTTTSTVEIAEVAEGDEPESRSGRRRPWLVAGAIAAGVGIVAATVAIAVGGSDDGQRVVVGHATLAVRAALDATMESGGYEIRFETESSGTAVGPQTVDGHGTINVRPYGLATVANVSGLGAILVRTDGVSIWEHGGGNYGLTPDGTEGPGSR